MRTFLKKTLVTLFVFLIGILSFVFVVHLTVKHSFNFDISKKDKYLILGHSHPECAFNDDLIRDFKNLSKSGESYFYTYQKVKEVIPNNGIIAVFIEYSNGLINKQMDEWIWGYEKMNAHLPWHSPFMDKEDLLFLYERNPQDFPKAISTSTRNNLTRILSLRFNIDYKYGGFNNLNESNVTYLMKEQNSDFEDVSDEEGISFANIKYLEKIIEYCNINNVKVFLIRSPQHNYFPKANEETLKSIKFEKFQNIEFLDFDKFPLEDNQFADFGHLNFKGAVEFSLWFNGLIENGLLSTKNKTVFINEEINKARMNKIY